MKNIREKIASRLSEAEGLLCEMIQFPSTSGNEEELIRFLKEKFAPVADEANLISIPNSIREDEDYSTPIPDLNYKGRHNLEVLIRGKGGGKSLIFNAHTDVVPPSLMQESPFEPKRKDNVIYGRGACDCKGQIAVLYLVAKLLRELGISLSGNLLFHFVIEEENGGNGTLALVRRGVEANGAIILEPTGLKIIPSVRGAVWFRVSCFGRAGHSGSAGETVSALKTGMEAVKILETYQAQLLKESKGIELFDAFHNPMPITFGKFQSGNWPAVVPNKAVIEGVLGFLQNKTHREVREEMATALRTGGSKRLRDNFRLEFTYKHDTSILPQDQALLLKLSESLKESGTCSEVAAMPSSCDAWFYNNQAKIPTLVFGVGSLNDAHTDREKIEMEQIAKGAEVLLGFICRWCGLR